MQQAIKSKIDYSKIKDFDDIPFHGDPNREIFRLPKGFRGNEKRYEQYLKENNIDASKLSISDVENIIKEL